MNIKLNETRNTKKPEAIDNESIEMGCGHWSRDENNNRWALENVK